MKVLKPSQLLPKLDKVRKVIAGVQIGGLEFSIGVNPSPSILPSIITPWLMIPQDRDLPKNILWFHTLAEQAVIGFANSPLPNNDFQFVGSSHGWIPVFNRSKRSLSLYNPLLIKGNVDLPPIHTFEYCVSKVILSRSPFDESCCAVMRYGPGDELAFCYPNRSNDQWTPIEDDQVPAGGNYESFVFGKSGNIYCLRRSGEFESWDLQNPESPRRLQVMMGVDYPSIDYPENCKKLSFLVVNPFSGCLYLVVRIEVAREQGEYKTDHFQVYKFDPKKSDQFKHMVGTLEGLSFFIGKNHSFVIRASRFPLLRPNSIYFAEVDELISDESEKEQNIGIFNYESETFWPSCFPSVKSCSECAMWFTPTNL